MNKWEEKFDQGFPEFIGIGAMFPIFNETPNREHIKSFINTLLEEVIDEAYPDGYFDRYEMQQVLKAKYLTK